MADRVSVIIPCFNYAHYLEDCVRSVVAQSYGEWECIIVDDGSTDNTSEVAERLAALDDRITIVRQNNAGLSAARNAGIRRARGQLIQFLDADDLLERQKLRVQADYFAKNRSTDIVVGPAGFFDSRSQERIRPWARTGLRSDADKFPREAPAMLRTLLAGNMWVVHAALVRRSMFDEVAGFDESLPAYEDWDFWLRCSLAGAVFSFAGGADDRALVREHRASMSTNRLLMARTALEVRERVHQRLAPALQQENAQAMARLKLKVAVELMRRGGIAEGSSLFCAAWRQNMSKVAALAELAGLVPGAFEAVRLGRRLYARWRTSANGR